MKSRFPWLLTAAVAALALLAGACGSDSNSGGGADGDLSGTTVNVFGAFVDVDADRFEQSLAAFEEETGIDVKYEGSGDFENLLNVRVEGGDAPDIAMFPQPGLMAGLARDDRLAPLDGDLLAAFQDNYDESWQTLGTVDDTPYGMWYRTSLKSLVWYPTPEFEDAGYTVPTSFEELTALADKIKADGTAPWCIGIESAGATGWVATDWVEDLMLRLHGPEVYDQWVNHEIPFNDPKVKEAVDLMGSIWLGDGNVFGGSKGILTTPFGDAPRSMFSSPPRCFLHRQATFITAFFPDAVQESLATDSPEAGAFYLPAINDEFKQPVLVAGDVGAMFKGNDRPEVRAVMEFLATPESGTEWAKAGGYLSPHKGFDATLLPTALEQQAAEIIAGADSVRFDGSDLMPAVVGTSSFWKGMVNYVNGASSKEVLDKIEASWPK